MSNDFGTKGEATSKEGLHQLLSHEPFQGLKAILDRVSLDHSGLLEEIKSANNLEELLGRLGYKLTVTRQIHVQDCYSRVGQAGGIKAVLPYYDIPTQGSFPMLVNFDSTVTATEKSAAYFNEILKNLKRQLSSAKTEKVQL